MGGGPLRMGVWGVGRGRGGGLDSRGHYRCSGEGHPTTQAKNRRGPQRILSIPGSGGARGEGEG